MVTRKNWFYLYKKAAVTTDEFIFSNKRADRLKRHAAFWGAYCLINFYAYFSPDSLKGFFEFSTYKHSFISLAFFLPSSIFLVYTFVYVLIPGYIKSKKYVTFICAAFLITIPWLIVDYFLARLYVTIAFKGLNNTDIFLLAKSLAYRAAIHGGLAFCGCAAGIKLAKEWYLQQKENTLLARREADSKIKLLKSHIRPEFLFHSLKNLYKKINRSANEAPLMVLYLSEIYSYILYDCDEEKVALEKELSAIQYLTAIEKINKGNSLKVNITVNGNIGDKYIPPLLLFSVFQRLFIENEGIKNNERRIDAVISIEKKILDLSLQLYTPGGSDMNSQENAKMITGLQESLPPGYLQYEEEENNTITVRIILFHPEGADMHDIKTAVKEYENV